VDDRADCSLSSPDPDPANWGKIAQVGFKGLKKVFKSKAAKKAGGQFLESAASSAGNSIGSGGYGGGGANYYRRDDVELDARTYGRTLMPIGSDGS
jgi:hypothetical protein